MDAASVQGMNPPGTEIPSWSELVATTIGVADRRGLDCAEVGLGVTVGRSAGVIAREWAPAVAAGLVDAGPSVEPGRGTALVPGSLAVGDSAGAARAETTGPGLRAIPDASGW